MPDLAPSDDVTANPFESAAQAPTHDDSNSKSESDPPPSLPKVSDSANGRAYSEGHKTRQRPAKPPESEDEDDDLGYYQSTLWWFTSTAFPLIAGSFGPLANLFSICALVQTWRVTVPDGKRVTDPPWLLALNVLSLVSGLCANILLLFNFARRIRYKIAQPFTIALWYLACILLIIPLALANTILLKASNNYTLSQSYYYALITAVIYFIIATLLVFNVFGAYKIHAYPPSFSSLTMPQRTLMLQTIAFSGYLALGAGVFSSIEGWEFVDALYWADYTLLTVGFGSDFPLQHTAGRILLIPYAAIGITSLGLVVSSVRGLVLERGKARISKRRLEKERERWELIISGQTPKPETRFFARVRRRKSIPSTPEPTDEGKGVEDDDHKVRRKKREFDLMRDIERNAKRSEGYIALASSIAVFAFIWGGGAVVFWACERQDNWTYTESLYFAYVAILTIGYGDFFPSTNATRPFFVIWSLVAVPAMTVLISNMGETVVKWLQDATLWLGHRSILPEQQRAQERRRRRRRHFRKKKGSKEEAAAAVAVENGSTPPPTSSSSSAQPPHTNSMEIEEIQRTVEMAEVVEESKEFEASLAVRLAREISHLAKDASNSTASRYEWDEWVTWLQMMDEVGEMLGEANEPRGEGGREVVEDNSRGEKWMWLDDHGPLFSQETETQWVLNRLCQLLEKVSERS